MSEQARIAALGRQVLAGLAEIRKKQAEVKELMKALERQAMAMLSGVEPNKIQTWGYDPLLDKRNSRVPAIWNFVMLRDRTRVVLDPVVPTGE